MSTEKLVIEYQINKIVLDMDKFTEEQGKCWICSTYLVFGDPNYTPYNYCSAECDLEGDRQYDNYEADQNERTI